MKKEDIIKELTCDPALTQTYDRILDLKERARVKALAEELLFDMCGALVPLFEGLESPEVKEQLAIQMSALLSGSRP